MIKMSELQVGDLVVADFEGQEAVGTVKELNHEDKEVCISSEVQDFWFKPEDLSPIPISDTQLKKLHFTREDQPDGSVKYKKGVFRILLRKADDFNDFEMWYREDRRHMKHSIGIHELQNHHLQMAKIPLTEDAVV
jgi:hypothetical protein